MSSVLPGMRTPTRSSSLDTILAQCQIFSELDAQPLLLYMSYSLSRVHVYEKWLFYHCIASLFNCARLSARLTWQGNNFMINGAPESLFRLLKSHLWSLWKKNYSWVKKVAAILLCCGSISWYVHLKFIVKTSCKQGSKRIKKCSWENQNIKSSWEQLKFWEIGKMSRLSACFFFIYILWITPYAKNTFFRNLSYTVRTRPSDYKKSGVF